MRFIIFADCLTLAIIVCLAAGWLADWPVAREPLAAGRGARAEERNGFIFSDGVGQFNRARSLSLSLSLPSSDVLGRRFGMRSTTHVLPKAMATTTTTTTVAVVI